MSLFRYEYLTGKSLQLDQVAPLTKSSLPGLQEGLMWNDSVQKQIGLYLNGLSMFGNQTLNVNNTPVTATNPSSAANLMTFAFPAGYLNVLNKAIYFFASGTYTTAAAQTPTVNFTLNLPAANQILTWTSSATTASVTKNWNLEGLFSVQTTGSSGKVEAHGVLNIELGAGAAGSVAASGFNDANAATIGTSLDLTAAQTLTFQTTMSTSNAGNNVVMRQLVLELYN